MRSIRHSASATARRTARLARSCGSSLAPARLRTVVLPRRASASRRRHRLRAPRYPRAAQTLARLLRVPAGASPSRRTFAGVRPVPPRSAPAPEGASKARFRPPGGARHVIQRIRRHTGLRYVQEVVRLQRRRPVAAAWCRSPAAARAVRDLPGVRPEPHPGRHSRPGPPAGSRVCLPLAGEPGAAPRRRDGRTGRARRIADQSRRAWNARHDAEAARRRQQEDELAARFRRELDGLDEITGRS